MEAKLLRSVENLLKNNSDYEFNQYEKGEKKLITNVNEYELHTVTFNGEVIHGTSFDDFLLGTNFDDFNLWL